MFKRMCWLLVIILLPLLLAAAGFSQVRGMMGETAVTAAPFDVIINEWSQGHGGNKEWVELLVVNGPVDLRGWDLGDSSPGDLTFSQDIFWQALPSGSLIVIYNGAEADIILPVDDVDLSDCAAVIPHNHAQLFSGSWPALSNDTTTDNPYLRDQNDTTMHDFSTGPGSSLHPGSGENAQYNGETAVGVSLVGSWSNSTAALATPGSGNGGLNTAWITQLCQGQEPVADVAVTKDAPAQAAPDSALVYTITVRNFGSLTATAVVLTDTLPHNVTYMADNSGFPLDQPDARTLVWQAGQIEPGAFHQFVITTTAEAAAFGVLENVITATTTTTETNLSNNWDTALTTVGNGAQTAVILDAVLYDGWAANDADEALALRNVGGSPVNLGGWQLNGKALPNLTLAAGEVAWLTRSTAAFTQQFGFAPAAQLISWPGFTNTGDEVLLTNDQGQVVDVLVYEAGNTGQSGWSGTAVQPYAVSGQEGQILYRRRDPITALPVPDTNTAADWAQSRDDVINGRKVRYPGWDLDEFFFTTQVTETAVLTIAIAPDNAYEAVVAQINSAHTSIQGEFHTLENAALGDALSAAARRGVSVTLLLEGGPAGGVTDQEHYLCQQLIEAGGLCAFMINDADASPKIFDRYDYLHAKFMLIDGERVLIGSQNLSPNSLPNDDKSDGTWGRRGVMLITDAPQVLAHVQTVFERDFDAAHLDIRPGVAHLDPLPIGFVPITQTGGTTYTVRYPQPTAVSGVFPFEIVQSPENSLREADGLLGLVNRAGAGDEVWVQQLYERPFWGSSASNPLDDPNPRLEAYINAARRGASVRIMLDEFFDDARKADSNAAACQYVRAIARLEHLRLECALANPTGLGIHNKMVLVRLDGQGYIHVGSINGSETSNKANRELALQVQSNEAYALLADMFDHDWPYRAYLPAVLNHVQGPASHVLISEVQYNPPGMDDGEYVELANPTSLPVDLSGYSLGDAVNPTDFEDVRRFPPGTVIAARSPMVVAVSAAAFFTAHGFYPDFEILETVTAVPNLIDDPAWGDPAAFFQLGNSGDEILLRSPSNQIVDVVTYGSGSFPGVVACPLVTLLGSVLERAPYYADTDDCLVDFREWPFPSPGKLPD